MNNVNRESVKFTLLTKLDGLNILLGEKKIESFYC